MLAVRTTDLDFTQAKKNKKRKHKSIEPSPEPEKTNQEHKGNKRGNQGHLTHRYNKHENHENDAQAMLPPRKKTKSEAQVDSTILSTEDPNAIAGTPPPPLALPKPRTKALTEKVSPNCEERIHRPVHEILTTLLEDHRGRQPRKLEFFQIYEDAEDSHVVPVEPNTHWYSWSSEEEKENLPGDYNEDSDGEDGDIVLETEDQEEADETSADSTNSSDNDFRYVYPLQEVFIPGREDFDRASIERRYAERERDYFGYPSDDDADDETPAEEDEKYSDMELLDMMVQSSGSVRMFMEYLRHSSGGPFRDSSREDLFTCQSMPATAHDNSKEQDDPYEYDRAGSLESVHDDPRDGTEYASELEDDTDYAEHQCLN
jgi:hypothetical protein